MREASMMAFVSWTKPGSASTRSDTASVRHVCERERERGRERVCEREGERE